MAELNSRSEIFNHCRHIKSALLFKKERIPNLLKLHIGCKELYVVPYVGLTWAGIVKDLKISELLKHIMTWLARSPGAKGSFFSMCKYLFNQIDALSVIGSKKEQREFIDTLLQHLPYLFIRYRGVISFNLDMSFRKFDPLLVVENEHLQVIVLGSLCRF